MTKRTWLVWLVWLLAGCQASALDQRLDVIDEPRLLAVISDPAEAKPGSDVSYSALIATPTGPLAAPPTWDFCLAPKPPTEDDAVSQICLGDVDLAALGTAPTVTGTLPAKGCSLFGPDTPPGGFRPRDPDSTGGFYQPVRLDGGGVVGIGLTRITCDLPDAPGDLAHDYQLNYVANANPTLLPTSVPATVAAGSAVTIAAAWPATAAESYLFFDPGHQTLTTRREAMKLSWYATAGAFPVDATAVGEDDPTTSVSTTWTAPAQPGSVVLWLVLRDSRGGATIQQLSITVQ
jgi:hypothetical protein